MNGLIRGAAALILAGALSAVCLAGGAAQTPDAQSQGQTGAQGQTGDQSGAQTPGDTAAPGDHHHGHGAVRAACQDDIAKLCSADADGHGAFRCLREHQDTLSDSCKTALTTALAQRREHGGWSHRGGGQGAGPDGDAQDGVPSGGAPTGGAPDSGAPDGGVSDGGSPQH